MDCADEGTTPDKRQKTLSEDPGSPFISPTSLISKGKSKIQEEPETLVTNDAKDEELCGDSCGICLSESGTTGVSRGYIDSCDHYFCFLCIMEWAKVESKCPLCKRRFSTIRRPAKPHVFDSERVVQVPVRDQVYHVQGNATIGPPDPYSEIRCSVCLGQDDEFLLLLCDLCDTAAHTYCIGLGATVPEGDWFCQECTVLRDERLKCESDQESECPIRVVRGQNISSEEEAISIFDIVRDSPAGDIRRNRNLSIDSGQSQLSSPAIEVNTVDVASLVSQNSGTQHKAKINTRTLPYRRNLNNRICLLRKNWTAIQRGVLQFSNSTGDSECSGRISCASGVAQQSLSSASCGQLAQCSSSLPKADDREHEIQKAWKMMDKAKAITQRHESSSIRSQECMKSNGHGNGRNVSHIHRVIPDTRRGSSRNAVSIGSGYHNNHSLERDLHEESFPMERRFEGSMRRPFYGDAMGSTTTNSRAHLEPESFNAHNSPVNPCPRNLENITRSSVKVPMSSTASESMSSDTDSGVHKAPLSCSSAGSHAARKKRLESTSLPTQKYDEAKSEVRSQVKRYLELRTKKEKLDADAFKEVARRATHSILAACGFEAHRPGFCSIPVPACSHVNNTSFLQKPILLPNTCTDCFRTFIKEIVDAALSQNTGL